ncbi:hypothetical protein Taro_009061 [Colocasia esculenta]|uniref:Uncharacterized protein n=1 Tax=Colocasia esculenta TaxID=4460 RepID=A0A843U301_COLES|nr:hypothetical protein [Colocasia esculenta]
MNISYTTTESEQSTEYRSTTKRYNSLQLGSTNTGVARLAWNGSPPTHGATGKQQHEGSN